uniref:DOMON domain-containing protein n=1 Tax=Elaeophora elaphi TaxID=1147741 RepID=A0A0R3RXF6_9BILA
NDLGCAAVCNYQQGQYKLQFARDQQNVHLQLTYHRYPTGTNTWTGVAFGHSMNDGLDFINVRVLDNKVLVTDEFVQGFRPPQLDAKQNIIVQSASLDNGNLRVRLARPVFSNDTADFSLANCLTWQFPFMLSPLDSAGKVRKHQITPQGMVVCIDQCHCGPASTPKRCQL